MRDATKGRRRKGVGATLFVGLVAAGTIGAGAMYLMPGDGARRLADGPLTYQKRVPLDTSGFSMIASSVPPWDPSAAPAVVRESWIGVGERAVAEMERHEASGAVPLASLVPHYVVRAMLRHAEGNTKAAAVDLEKARALTDREDALAVRHLSSLAYFQGVTALRRGENENCVMCRGDSSCILPIAESARHLKPAGSTAAIGYFTELLERFPDDLEAAWLLNVAHMTLGQYPDRVDPRFRLDLGPYLNSEFDIGRFRDVGADAGVNRFDQAGGAILEDFDGDGRLDLFVTSFDPKQAAGFYRNNGDGTFEDRSEAAGLKEQFGGLFCVQADYDDDGLMDVFIPRGAWLRHPMRPSLMRNVGGGVFEDVTDRAGLAAPMNSNSASWVDYDNDGDVDLFVCDEVAENRLYRNNGDGTFDDVAGSAGLTGSGRTFCKGACWADFDNDGDPDLFLNYLTGLAAAYRNDGGTFVEATEAMGIRGPVTGFSCWAFDYDNDGWEDVFATCYDRSLGDVVKGLIGRPHSRYPNRLYRNEGGRFVDQTKAAGLDGCYAAMGSNFADFDNDGFLDFYLGTGEPSFATLIPNRMFKNVDGKRFAEITASAGVGHLQKGHAVACGDYDRDGDVDLFVQIGGAVDGDRYHNVLFRNPGQGRRSLTMKLVGEKSNRAAIGARIKVTTGGPSPRTIHRTVSSGSSFGANALEQTIGLGDAESAALIEVRWPATGCVQTFRDVPAGARIEVVEFAEAYRKLDDAAPR